MSKIGILSVYPAVPMPRPRARLPDDEVVPFVPPEPVSADERQARRHIAAYRSLTGCGRRGGRVQLHTVRGSVVLPDGCGLRSCPRCGAQYRRRAVVSSLTVLTSQRPCDCAACGGAGSMYLVTVTSNRGDVPAEDIPRWFRGAIKALRANGGESGFAVIEYKRRVDGSRHVHLHSVVDFGGYVAYGPVWEAMAAEGYAPQFEPLRWHDTVDRRTGATVSGVGRLESYLAKYVSEGSGKAWVGFEEAASWQAATAGQRHTRSWGVCFGARLVQASPGTYEPLPVEAEVGRVHGGPALHARFATAEQRDTALATVGALCDVGENRPRYVILGRRWVKKYVPSILDETGQVSVRAADAASQALVASATLTTGAECSPVIYVGAARGIAASHAVFWAGGVSLVEAVLSPVAGIPRVRRYTLPCCARPPAPGWYSREDFLAWLEDPANLLSSPLAFVVDRDGL